MSKLQELINELCPDGVCYKNLGDFCKIQTGKGITSKDTIETGKYPVVSGGTEYMGYYNEYNREANTVTIARAGSAGYVNFINKKFYLNDKCFSIIPKDNTNTKYLYYVLKNMENDITAMKSTGSVPTVNTVKVSSISIPVPPLPVQEEIVRILDKMTGYVTELKAELKARKMQYEYYRDDLLAFGDNAYKGNLQELINELCPDGVTYEKISTVCDQFNGMTGVSNKWADNGNCRFIDYLNAYNNLKIDTTKLPYATVKNMKQNILSIGDILCTSASETPDECAISSVIENELPSGIFMDDHLFGIRVKDKTKLNPVFLNYYFRSKEFRLKINKAVRGVTRFYISNPDFMKLSVPVPPLQVQEEIVRILDKFSSICNDISMGLPAEIEARQKQYEYYRNKLLNFRKLETEEC